MSGDFRIKIIGVGQNPRGRTYVQIAAARGDGERKPIGLFVLEEVAQNPNVLPSAATTAGIPLVTNSVKSRFLREVQAALDRIEDLPSRCDFEVADQCGWHGDNFVTPYRVYGEKADALRTALTVSRPDRWTPAGTLEEWQEMVGPIGSHSELAVFAVCAAFAAPLLSLLGRDGVGFALVGKNSTAKTTLSVLAGSVWGGASDGGAGESWYATVNALEPMAAQFRHFLLVLDDIQRLPGGEKQRAEALHNAIFMLPSGGEKHRLTAAGPLKSWDLIYLATNNQTTRQMMEAGNRTYDPSMEVRLAQIPTDRPYGVFDTIPAGISPADYSDQIRERASLIYGSPIDAYLKRLTYHVGRSKEELVGWLKRRIKSQTERMGIDRARGSEARIAAAFALVYAAGRLARSYDILPWRSALIRDAILGTYRSHRQVLATETPQRDPVQRVRDFIRANRDQFIDLRKTSVTRKQLESYPGAVMDSRGYGREFAFTAAQFARNIGASNGVAAVVAALKSARLLHSDGDKSQTKRDLGDGERVRVYAIAASILDER